MNAVQGPPRRLLLELRHEADFELVEAALGPSDRLRDLRTLFDMRRGIAALVNAYEVRFEYRVLVRPH